MQKRLFTPALTALLFFFLLLPACRTTEDSYNPNDALGIAPASFPRELSEAVKESPEKNLSLLAAHIEKRAKTEKEKILLAHDWIVQNIAYDSESFFSEKNAVTDPYDVFRRGNTVCSGYANAFALLLDELDIENRVLRGYARGYGFDPFKEAERDPEKTSHAWTAVRSNGEWQLIDTTWDSGFTSKEEGFRFSYRRDYFLTAPKEFIHTHFTQNHKWQLLEDPLSYEEFLELPYLRPSFFRLDMEPDASHGMITKLEGKNRDSLEFPLPRRGESVFPLSASLYKMDTTERLSRYSMVVPNEENRARVHLRFPENGKYRLAIGTRISEDEYHPLGFYYFIVNGGEKTPAPFPRLHPRFFDLGMSWNSDWAGYTLVEGPQEQSIELTPPPKDKRDLELRCKLVSAETDNPHRGYTKIETTDDQQVKIRIRFPGKGNYDLHLFTRSRRGDYLYLGSFSYEVTTNQAASKPFRTEPGQG